ncbi:cytochrome B5-like protein isoform X2 [Iris pallida]|uniref:Cytochrome B5-like protein isoform X2 n=1 Tax=Iris pallida TaxID=29817 RepID=A0AAX6EXX2_IRIPA|nr:cytochrome B5-like protein isoform X2 [Iris pallida]KAJ6808980.1 cytochrome B5-like protein isoform X2 [Iris pallida]
METTMLVAFVVAIVLGALFLLPKSSIKGKARTSCPNDDTKKTVKAYSKEEVSLHNKKNDCWIIVKDKVYDVTPYVEEHPGGDAILNNAGRDSTEGFYGPQHATRVFDMVDEFYIGDLKS